MGTEWGATRTYLVHNPERGAKPWFANNYVYVVMDFLLLGFIPRYFFVKTVVSVDANIELYMIE